MNSSIKNDYLHTLYRRTMLDKVRILVPSRQKIRNLEQINRRSMNSSIKNDDLHTLSRRIMLDKVRIPDKKYAI